MKKAYVIHYSDPRSTEYHFEGREDICWDKGIFTNREVAEQVMNGIEMFKEVGDPTYYSIREINLHEDCSFEEWLDNNAPWRKGKAAG
jgi:hypothetical protein